MKNPFGPDPDSFHSYINLKKRMLALVQTRKVYDQINQVVQTAYDEALRTEDVPLTSSEKKIMFTQILRAMLEDMLQKLDDRARPA
jgi:hypothetical protein